LRKNILIRCRSKDEWSFIFVPICILITYNISNNEIIIINYRKCKFCLFMSIDIVSLNFPKILGTSQYWVCLGKIRSNDLFLPVQALGCFKLCVT
jgi:hypothetical protein